MIGKVIGTYQIVQQLGQGLHGTTYQAVEQGRGQPVVLKAIQPALAQQVAFKQNLRALAAQLMPLRHPHLAAFHTILQMGNELYVISEFVNGTPLNEALQHSGVLTCEEAVRLTVQILDALAYVHAAGIWHGGIKPNNLILTPDRRVKLTDLGLAQAAGAALWHEKLEASVFNYVAPEQLRGEACDARTDVYAIGAVLYEMLTGLPPFRRANETALRHAQLEELPPSPRNYFPLIPLPLEQAVLRALAKSPTARFSSAPEFRQALLSWANEAKVSGNAAATEMNSPATPASTSPPVSPRATSLPPAVTHDKFATKPQMPLAPNDWPQLTPPLSAGKTAPASASSIVSTGLNDELVVSLEESAAGKRSFWRPIAAVTGVAALLGVTYAVVRVNNGDTPTLGPNQSIIRVSPTVPTPSVSPTTPDKLSETAVPSPTEPPRLKEPATVPTIPLKRPTAPALRSKSKPAPPAKASTTLLPSKINKAKPTPTPGLGKKKPTPTPTPASTKKGKKKDGGVGGFFKGVFGGSGKEKKAEPTPKQKKPEPTPKPKKY